MRAEISREGSAKLRVAEMPTEYSFFSTGRSGATYLRPMVTGMGQRT